MKLIYHFILQSENQLDYWHWFPDTSLSCKFSQAKSQDRLQWSTFSSISLFNLICLRAENALSHKYVIPDSDYICRGNISSWLKCSLEISFRKISGIFRTIVWSAWICKISFWRSHSTSLTLITMGLLKSRRFCFRESNSWNLS